ncbi:hypothetical protein J2Z69_002045 [Paenibacillus shirakamiensis]|uniref:EspG family protein n=1 Tax=Paenibacillus shirakamiensis TaxID=1265935 RepID=A0ABS4JH12_9BACL|nr:hypothetical protein [Paenibacillus shirakamiensis]MBP2001002.1 hypothetical protein [Paenibacillus shirakamiensis]
MLTTSYNGEVALEREELFFLAGILGSDRLLGVDDPFKGFLSEEIVQEWEKSKQSLLSKGYLIQAENGVELLIPPEVFSRVAIAGLAERACWISYRTQEDSYEGYMHITDEKVVEVQQPRDQVNLYELREKGTIPVACDDLVQRMKWNDKSPGNMPALLLSRAKFNELYNSSSTLSMDEMSSVLVELTDDPEGSLALAKSLKHRLCDGELQLSVWNGQAWDTQGAAFLINDHVNWLIRRSSREEDDWLIATPTTREQFQSMLLLWLERPSQTEER